ncbi:MAG: amidase [Planctomycetes bacterium]|nr:amidase [Planctomycetota bacterium]
MADPTHSRGPRRFDRRAMLGMLAGTGVGTPVLHRALAVQAEQSDMPTAEMVRQAEWISGIPLDDAQRESLAAPLGRLRTQWARLREASLEYADPPALAFFADDPALSDKDATRALVWPGAAAERPSDDDELAFLTVIELGGLLRNRAISSEELTRLYLARLERYDPILRCVVSRTDERALRQARDADRELAAGTDRGPLHGIPWGAKDLIAYPGYRTTWGAKPFQEQNLDHKATVAERLDEAGAVLVAKLTLGALAWGDEWFGGMTRNPWRPSQGSSGSSAGSAAATVAGLTGFALGSETLGSIISPCRRCGVTGLRPTFGRVSRHGCMTLAWSMDKIGPIARSARDCAIVLAAIHGRDGRDVTAVNRPLAWPEPDRRLRVGFFEGSDDDATRAVLDALRVRGHDLRPITLPSDPPVSALSFILNVEAATVFDHFTREGITDGLNRWPPVFQQSQFVPAVEYLRANRFRTRLMRAMARLFEDIDAYVGGDDLLITNLTGHPTVVFPAAIAERDGVSQPVCAKITGRLFAETDILFLADQFQQSTDFHRRRPELRAEGANR